MTRVANIAYEGVPGHRQDLKYENPDQLIGVFLCPKYMSSNMGDPTVVSCVGPLASLRNRPSRLLIFARPGFTTKDQSAPASAGMKGQNRRIGIIFRKAADLRSAAFFVVRPGLLDCAGSNPMSFHASYKY